MNLATSFFDASQLYGHNLENARSIRTFDGGKLKTDIINGHEFCPQKERHGSLLCDGRDNVKICFESGNIFVLQLVVLLISGFQYYSDNPDIRIQIING